MIKKKTTKKRLDVTIREMAEGLYNLGKIDLVTMRQYETLQLPKVHDLSPKKIKNIRLKEKISQAVFAEYLNTSVHTIRDWEQGKKHPRGSSLKLLNMVSEKGIKILL